MAVTPADQDEAFLREVDENLRRDQLADFGRRYGKLIIGAVVAGLLVLAGVLWWQHHRATVAGEQGEQLQTVFDKIGGGDFKSVEAPLAELAGSKVDGYRAAALMTQAAVAVERNDTKTAIAKFAAVAGDTSLDKAYRDLALIKQTMLEFDALPPQTVIDRLKPIAVKDNAFFGTASEMVGLAQIRLNKRAEAGATFAAIAKEQTAPDTIRQRAVQMAGVLGVDAVDQGEARRTKGGTSESGTSK